jgi:molybdopterin biosynthesis enzyme
MVRELEFHGSAHLTALSATDGFFVIPTGAETVRRGQLVTVFVLPGSWR